jgi:hypothetical protein
MANTTAGNKKNEERLGDKMSSYGESIGEKAKDMASDFASQARGVASTAAESAQSAASYVGQKAEDATSAVGKGVRSLGGTVRDRLPSSGFLGGASSAIADTLDRTGEYIQNEGIGGMAEDMTAVVRRNPLPALLIAVGVGFLLARAVNSRS